MPMHFNSVKKGVLYLMHYEPVRFFERKGKIDSSFYSIKCFQRQNIEIELESLSNPPLAS